MGEKKDKSTYRDVNKPAQHRAHAGGAAIGPANGGGIEFAPYNCVFTLLSQI
jgi:hypothetical protein